MSTIEIKYGIIYSLALLVWISVGYLLGLQSTYIALHPYFSAGFLFVGGFILYRGVKAKLAQRDDEPTFGMAFLSGFWIVVVAVLLSPAVNYLFHTYINPDFFPTMIEHAVTTMQATRDMAEAYFSLGSYIKQGIVGGLISGVIMAVLVAFIVKNPFSGK